MHQLHQLAGDGGAKAGAAKAARHAGVGLGERGEDAVQPVGGNADAGVAHRQLQLAAVLAYRQRDAAALGELDGVAQQVGEDLPHAQRVAVEGVRATGGVIQLQLQAFAGGLQREGAHQLLAQRVQREIVLLQRQRTALQLGGIEDVVEQAQQRVGGVVHGAQVARLLWRQRRALQQLGKADDGVHRGADFVAHIGQEHALGLGGVLGAVARFHQLALHALARGEVAGQLDDLPRFAVGVEDGVVSGLDPYLAAVGAQAAELATVELAALQRGPEVAVGLAVGLFRPAQPAVMLAAQRVQPVTHQLQEVVVGVQDVAVQVELQHRHGLADGGHHACVLGGARLAVGDVHDHAVYPLRAVVHVVHTTGAFRYPALAAIAVEDAVFHHVGTVLAQRTVHRVAHAGQVVGVHDADHAEAAVEEQLALPAGKRGDGVADEQLAPVGVHLAAERHAGHVGDQRAVLGFARLQLARQPGALADVGHKADEAHLLAGLGAAYRQPDRKHAAVAALRHHLAPHADHAGVAGGQVVRQVAVVARTVGVGHQLVDVVADQLAGGPAEHLLGGLVQRQDVAAAIDGDDAVHGGIHHRAQLGLVLLHLRKQLAVAQHGVTGQHKHAGREREQRNGQRQVGIVALQRRARRVGVADETRRRHAGVVHAGDGQPHHQPAQHDGLYRAEGAAPAQAEAYPQRQHGQHHRHHDGRGKPQRVVAQLRRHHHGGHAAVVHGADAAAHQHAAQQQLQAGDLALP